MFTTNKNKASVILFLAAFTAFGVAGYNPPKEPVPGDFKNLQILPKDISKEGLDKVMHNFNDALGVKCGFCHVHKGDDWKAGWEFDSDEKDEKNIARMMMKMTRTINVNHFNFNNSAMPDTINVVTCNTCHRGIAHPDTEGIMEQQKKSGVPPAGIPPPPPPPGAPKN